MADEPFEFTIYVGPEVVRGPGQDEVRDVWSVSLPHQCDDWSVAWGTKEEVADELRRFIAEAEATLAALPGVDACPHEWVDMGDERENTHNGGTARTFQCSRCQRAVSKVVDRSTAQPWYAEKYYGAA